MTVSKNVRNFSIFILFVCGSVLCATAAVDRTLEEDAVGRDVVDATVEKIHASGIFPDDHEFLRRLAYVSTRDRGSQRIKPPDDNFGGLWNVTFDMYNKTLAPTLAIQHEQIQDYFNISWENTTWHDLRTPLYSGLAARLYVHSVLPEVPVAVMDQATMWSLFYMVPLPAYWKPITYVNLSQEYEASVLSYSTSLDLLILIDSSGSSSATPENFDVYKKRLSEFFQLLPLLTDSVRVGLIAFNNQAEVVLPFNYYTNMNDTLEAIASLKNPTGSANTNAALELARDIFLNATNHTAFKAVITLTEGNSATGVGSVTLLQDLGIATYAVGMYSNPNKDELLKLAGENLGRVFSWTDSEQLDILYKILHKAGTEISYPLTLGMLATTSLVKHELRYYKIDLPSEGITLSFQSTEGSVSGFYCATKEFPNSAIYDEQIDNQRGSFVEPSSLGSETIFVAIEGDQFANTFSMNLQKGNQVGSGAGRGMNSGVFTIMSTFVVALIAANLN